jgi:hypothetical protein
LNKFRLYSYTDLRIVVYRLKAGLYESKLTSILRNVYNKNKYFSGNGVKTSSVSAEMITLTTAASETVKLRIRQGVF